MNAINVRIFSTERKEKVNFDGSIFLNEPRTNEKVAKSKSAEYEN